MRLSVAKTAATSGLKVTCTASADLAIDITRPRRDAVAGDVADRHRQPPVLERQDVVEVAAHLGRRQVDVGELDPAQLRRQLRQDRALDVARRLELDPLALALGDPADMRRHILVAVDEDPVGDQVAGGQQQRDGARQDTDPALQLQARVGGEDEREDRTAPPPR